MWKSNLLSCGFLSALLYHYSIVQHIFSPIKVARCRGLLGRLYSQMEFHFLCVAPVALFTSQLRFGLRLQTAFPLNSAIILRMPCNITYGRRSDNYAFITLSDFTGNISHFLYLSFFVKSKEDGVTRPLIDDTFVLLLLVLCQAFIQYLLQCHTAINMVITQRHLI